MREFKRSAGVLTLATLAVLAAGMLATPAAWAAPADLSISKTDSPDPVEVGQDVTYTITVTNNDLANNATGVEALDSLPSEVTFKSVTSSPDVGCFFDGTFARCPFATVPANTSVTMTVVATVNQRPSDGSITNFCSVFSDDDPDDANDHCSIETQVVQPFLTIAKTDSPDPVKVGTTLTYTIVVRNTGTATATAVQLTDFLASSALFSTAPGCMVLNQVVTCPIGDMPAGSIATVQIRVVPTVVGTIGNAAHAAGSNTNLASVVEPTKVFCIPEVVFTDLDIMDNILSNLKKGDPSEKKVKERTKQVDDIKLDMLGEHFPDVLGVDFESLYLNLKFVDNQMARARRLADNRFFDLDKNLGKAQDKIEGLRGLLAGSSVPEAVRTDLDIMDNILSNLKKGDPSEKKVKERTKQVDDIKLDMLGEHFPDVLGVDFESLYLNLKFVDNQMARARRLADNRFFDLDKNLGKAQDKIEGLRGLLAGAG